MKELILLRHAKSSWESQVADIDRPLLPKGIERITAMTKKSISLFERVDQVFSSPANRALHTAVLMMRNANLPLHLLKLEQSLYTFDAEGVLSFIDGLKFENKRIVLVGHNPAFTLAANYLGDLSVMHLPTAAWVHLTWTNPDDNLAKTTIGNPNEILKS